MIFTHTNTNNDVGHKATPMVANPTIFHRAILEALGLQTLPVSRLLLQLNGPDELAVLTLEMAPAPFDEEAFKRSLLNFKIKLEIVPPPSGETP